MDLDLDLICSNHGCLVIKRGRWRTQYGPCSRCSADWDRRAKEERARLARHIEPPKPPPRQAVITLGKIWR